MKSRYQENTPKEQPPFAAHFGRLVGITDLGLRPEFTWQGKLCKSEYCLELTYELVNALMEDGRPFHVSEQVTNKLTKNPQGDLVSKLTRRVQATAADPDNISSMLGQTCMITLTEKDNGYPKISEVNQVPQGVPVKELVNDTWVFDLDEPDVAMFLDLPEFKRMRIQENLEFEGSLLQIGLDRIS